MDISKKFTTKHFSFFTLNLLKINISKNFIIVICSLLILVGCNYSASEKEKIILERLVSKVILEANDNDLNEEKNISDSLLFYLDNPIDFFSVKSKTHMLNGGSFNLEDDLFYSDNDENKIYYNYWAFELENNKNTERSLVFKVLKPWSKNSSDRYYSTDNEILVGMKSKIAWAGLGKSNFVGQSEKAIIEKFGEPNSNKNDCLIYSGNNKLLVLKIYNHEVLWFKYLWLKEVDETFIVLPDKVFEF